MQLTIEKFSCIEHATIEISKFTVIVGPQASGKSIISKLAYFFINLVHRIQFDPDETKSLKSFQAEIAERFLEWFPPQTWGRGSFRIEMQFGSITIGVTRGSVRRNSKPRINIAFSDQLVAEFATYTNEVKLLREKVPASRRDNVDFRYVDLFWRSREKSRRRIAKLMRSDAINAQFFVPAGRSFFTSMGKTIVAFEQARILDPITINFGKLFSSLRDERRYYPSNEDKATRQATDNVAKKLFGGEIKIRRDNAHIEHEDGRIIPFSYLSSGQQEALPLWMAIDHILRIGPDMGMLVYIEEPEAHLFPSAQDVIMDYLSILISERSKRRLIITTHSPYILSKINNQLLAGELSSKLGNERDKEISEIIPRQSWLRSSYTRAYAIINGRVLPVMNDSGLIDGDYLDSVSGKLGDEFMSLLELEAKSK